ncbi:MAG: ribonuclease J, partial [Geminicoccaceae bacterium]|nr:ribonuclease J [Geminicoccaceae bacterium]
MTNQLLFVPLGGVGEIGMNVYLYGLDDRWMMVDLGLTFADDRLPGADIVLPDLSFIEERKDELDGIVVTHAHEDHIGAIPHLWARLGCPIYCSRFPAAVLRRKLAENGIRHPAAIHEKKPGESFEVGPFRCRFLHVTHSIPDANALAIDTPFGRIMHTGDWKLDPAPMIGERTDAEGLEAFGDAGVLALVADSTNVLAPGTSGSETEVRDSLIELIAAQSGRVVLTTFASNIARLRSAMEAGRAAGREVVVIGRSMHRMLDAAEECGLLGDLPPLLDERDAKDLPPERLMLLVTGSQGEPRAALMRIAFDSHPRIKLEPGDTAIFSSKIIPGNERTLYNLHNQLVERGVEVITEEDHFVHVSGHP